MHRRCFVSTSGTLTTRTFFSAHPQFQRDSAPVVPGLVKHQLPDLPNSCGQSCSGSFATRAVSIRGMEIHPTGCLPYGNELLHGGSTNVSTKKWSLSSERGQMAFSPCEGLVFQHKLPLQWRGGRGKSSLNYCSTGWKHILGAEGIGVFLHQSQT